MSISNNTIVTDALVALNQEVDENHAISLPEGRAPRKRKPRATDVPPIRVQPHRNVKRAKLNLEQDESDRPTLAVTQETRQEEGMDMEEQHTDKVPMAIDAVEADEINITGPFEYDGESQNLDAYQPPESVSQKETKSKRPRKVGSSHARPPKKSVKKPKATGKQLKNTGALVRVNSEMVLRPRLWTSTRRELALFTWFTEKNTRNVIGNGDSTGTSILFDESNWFQELTLVGTDIIFSVARECSLLSPSSNQAPPPANPPSPPPTPPALPSPPADCVPSIMKQKGRRSAPKPEPGKRQPVMKQVGKRSGPRFSTLRVMEQVGKRSGPKPSATPSYAQDESFAPTPRDLPSTPMKGSFAPSTSAVLDTPTSSIQLLYPSSPLSPGHNEASSPCSIPAVTTSISDHRLSLSRCTGLNMQSADESLSLGCGWDEESQSSYPIPSSVSAAFGNEAALGHWNFRALWCPPTPSSPSNIPLLPSLGSETASTSVQVPVRADEGDPFEGLIQGQVQPGPFYHNTDPTASAHLPEIPNSCQREHSVSYQGPTTLPPPSSASSTRPLAILRENALASTLGRAAEPATPLAEKRLLKGPFVHDFRSALPTPPASACILRRTEVQEPSPSPPPSHIEMDAQSQSRRTQLSVPDTPNEVQDLVKLYISGASINVFVTRMALALTEPSLCLPEEYGYIWMGRFRVVYVKEEVDPVSARVTWQLRLTWYKDGEIVLPWTDASSISPWWMDKMVSLSANTDESSDKFRDLKKHHFDLEDAASFFVIDCLNQLGTGRKDNQYSRGWVCAFCGRMNEERMMRHRKCLSSVCKTCPIPPGYSRSIEELRGVGESLPVLLPNIVDSANLFTSTANRWSDDMLVIQYTTTSHDSLQFSLVFGGNRASLQSEASELFTSLQREAILIRDNSSPYFVTNVEPDQWGSCAESLSSAKEYILDRVSMYAEIPNFDFDHLKILGWLASTSCGSPGHPWTFDAHENDAVIVCLGAETTLQLSFPDSFSAFSAIEDQTPPEEEEHAAEDAPPTAPTLEVNQTKKGRTKGDQPVILLTLYHGDVLVLSGITYKIAAQRTGTTLLLLGTKTRQTNSS